MRESGVAAALTRQDRACEGYGDQCGDSEQNGEYDHKNFLLDLFGCTPEPKWHAFVFNQLEARKGIGVSQKRE